MSATENSAGTVASRASTTPSKNLEVAGDLEVGVRVDQSHGSFEVAQERDIRHARPDSCRQGADGDGNPSTLA
jgi:hypothetical protein